MNIEQLIAALEEIEDKSTEVFTEGCDCWGDVNSVEVVDGTLLICRSPEKIGGF